MNTSMLVAESVWQEIESTNTGRFYFKFKFPPSFPPTFHLLSSRFNFSEFSLASVVNTSFSFSVTDDHLSILHFLFGKNFERATRIVDQIGVKRISGEPSGRSIFQVVGESKKKEEYLCFAKHYCGCYSFFYDIVNRGEQLCCKHQLAARLATSIGTCIDVKVSDEELALLLSKI